MSSSENAPANESVNIGPDAWLHFVGAAGSGMSALAQFHALGGGRTTGSDRAFDRGQQPLLRGQLQKLGVEILPQDGAFLGAEPGRRPDAVIASTAIESAVPDVAAAREAGVPLLHRSELLARYVEAHRTLAISGTSGKSTVTAMVFHLLRAGGLEPGLLTGGALAGLQNEGHVGNAWAPGARDDGPPWLVIEADESDGSLVRYRPWGGAVLNLGLDHKEPAEILAMFHTFSERTPGPLLVGADPELSALRRDGLVFGIHDRHAPRGAAPSEGWFARDLELLADRSRFTLRGERYEVPLAGRYNVLNATAALAMAAQTGLDPASLREALSSFEGVARRFQSLGTAGGVEVIDDFAHNPDKIEAALSAARLRTRGRILAFFQPHGFGPTRFLRAALVETFAENLRPADVLWMPEIFFAGGTVTRDLSAADLVADIAANGRDARFAADRDDLVAAIAAEARPGDLALVMGARDPSLTGFGRALLAALEEG